MLPNYYRNLLSVILLPILTALFLSGCSVSGAWQVSNADAGSEALSSIPTSVQRDYEKAAQAFRTGDYAAAEVGFTRFVEQHPEFSNAYVNLAILMDHRGDSEAAIHLLRHAIEVDSRNIVALNRLGVIYRQRGEFAAAEQAWMEATRIEPDYAYAWYNLGVLYDLYLQDLTAALDHYQRYQELVSAAEFAGEADPDSVQNWIVDLQRRIGDTPKTASATETM
jgi:tetratricopeptide (TPR) repeat protein